MGTHKTQPLVALYPQPGCASRAISSASAPEDFEIFAFPDQRRMTVSSYGVENIRKLRGMNFVLAVSLYNIDHGLGYSNIDLLALASKAKSVRGYNSRGTFAEVTRSTAIKKAFMEKTTMFWVGINYFATSILFVIITLALIGEWLMRLPFKKKHTPAPTPSPSVREAVKVQV